MAESAPESAPAPGPGEAEERREAAALAGRLIRGGWMVAAGSWWSIGLGFAAMVVMTRLLPTEAIGAFAFAYYLASLVMLQPKVAVAGAFLQHRADDAAGVGSYAALDLVLAVGTVVPALAILPFVPGRLRGLFAVLVLAGIVNGLASPLLLLLEKRLAFAQLTALQVAAVTLSYVPAVWLATRGAGAWSLVAQNVSVALLTLGGASWVNRTGLVRIVESLRHFDPALGRRFAAFGLAAGTTAFAAAQATTIDTFLVGALLGTVALGFYDRGSRTAQWPALLFNAVSGRTALQAYARFSDDRVSLSRAFSLSAWFIGVATFPLALVLFVAAPELIGVLFGERWLQSAAILRVLVVASALRPLWENSVAFFNGIGKPRVTTGVIAAQLAVLVLLGVPLTLGLGAIGAGIAASASMVAGIVLLQIRLRRELPFSLSTALAVPLAAGALSLAGSLGVVASGILSGLPPLARLALEAVLVLALFFAALFSIQPAVARERFATVWRLSRSR
jgi:O-antigen/teichoic acid export membrane protein